MGKLLKPPKHPKILYRLERTGCYYETLDEMEDLLDGEDEIFYVYVPVKWGNICLETKVKTNTVSDL